MTPGFIRDTLYHSLLRIAMVVTAFVLVFDSGLLSETSKQLSDSTQHYVANVVSVSAGVAPTELNTLTAELTEQKQALEAREAALAAREITLERNQAAGGASDQSTFILSLILFLMLSLIILNYGLDYVRMRRLVLEAHA